MAGASTAILDHEVTLLRMKNRSLPWTAYLLTFYMTEKIVSCLSQGSLGGGFLSYEAKFKLK